MKRTMIALSGGVLFVALGSPAFPKSSALATRKASSFIVWCDCDTQIKRAQMLEKISRAGGKVFYVYEQMNGLAVIVPVTRNRAGVERKLRKIPGVFGVQPDRAFQMGKPGEPQ